MMSPCDAMEAIVLELSGRNWTPETLEVIAEICEAAGYAVAGPDDEEEDPHGQARTEHPA